MDRDILSAEAIASLATRLPNWDFDGISLFRVLDFADFAEAFAFMVRVADIAEELDHHPDWSNSWNRVTIAVTSHSAGGLTGMDVGFAERVDRLADDQPG